MKQYTFRKVISLFICFFFTSNLIIPPSHAQIISRTILNLPVPGTMIMPTPTFDPAVMRGIMIYPDNPLKFDFVIDKGEESLSDEDFKKESMKLVKYFLASLTVPEKDMWVNLSPYEKNRIVPDNFGATEMGRDLLAQDYMLKQLTASLMSPDNASGKEFWNKIYAKIKDRFGATDIPLNTFNKVWIIPDKVSVYEHTKGALIIKSHLKVMLEEDYVAMEHNSLSGHTALPADAAQKNDNSLLTALQSQMVREILIPEIEREVNEGKTFIQLRQIYNSMILATWYKKALKESLLGKMYVNQNKTKGVENDDKDINQKIYNQYIEAFKNGAYEYIKEDYNAETQEVTTRKYISGGVALASVGNDKMMAAERDPQAVKDVVDDMTRHGEMLGVVFGNENGGQIALPEMEKSSDTATAEGISRRKFGILALTAAASGLFSPLLSQAQQSSDIGEIRRIDDILWPALIEIDRQAEQGNETARQFNKEFFKFQIMDGSGELVRRDDQKKHITSFIGSKGPDGLETYDPKVISRKTSDTIEIKGKAGTYEIDRRKGIVSFEKDGAMIGESTDRAEFRKATETIIQSLPAYVSVAEQKPFRIEHVPAVAAFGVGIDKYGSPGYDKKVGGEMKSGDEIEIEAILSIHEAIIRSINDFVRANNQYLGRQRELFRAINYTLGKVRYTGGVGKDSTHQEFPVSYENQALPDPAMTATQQIKELGKVQKFYNKSHPIQLVLAEAIKLIEGGQYQEAWNVLDQANELAFQAYNVFGMPRLAGVISQVKANKMVTNGKADVLKRILAARRKRPEAYYQQIKTIKDVRIALTETIEAQGGKIFQPQTGQDELKEALDITRRYGGEPDRYDPDNISELTGQIQREYEARGYALTPVIVEHINRVMSLLDVIGRKPRMKGGIKVDPKMLAEVNAPKNEKDRLIREAQKSIGNILSLNDSDLENYRATLAGKKIEVRDIDTMHDITRLSIAGSYFAGSESDLKKRLEVLFDSKVVDLMLKMVMVGKGRIFMNSEGVEYAYSQKVFPLIEQIAKKAQEVMQEAPVQDAEAQMVRLKFLLQDPEFAREMAEWLEGAYYRGIGEQAPPFIEPGQEEATIAKLAVNEKIAMNVAGFYALESGLGYILELEKKKRESGDADTMQTPVDVLNAIVNKTLSNDYMMLLARFANATWKASQPFRDLARIKKDNFIPAILLSEEEIRKDFVQIEQAAAKLSSKMLDVAMIADGMALKELTHDEKMAFARKVVKIHVAQHLAGYKSPIDSSIGTTLQQKSMELVEALFAEDGTTPATRDYIRDFDTFNMLANETIGIPSSVRSGTSTAEIAALKIRAAKQKLDESYFLPASEKERTLKLFTVYAQQNYPDLSLRQIFNNVFYQLAFTDAETVRAFIESDAAMLGEEKAARKFRSMLGFSFLSVFSLASAVELGVAYKLALDIQNPAAQVRVVYSTLQNNFGLIHRGEEVLQSPAGSKLLQGVVSSNLEQKILDLKEANTAAKAREALENLAQDYDASQQIKIVMAIHDFLTNNPLRENLDIRRQIQELLQTIRVSQETFNFLVASGVVVLPLLLSLSGLAIWRENRGDATEESTEGDPALLAQFIDYGQKFVSDLDEGKSKFVAFDDMEEALRAKNPTLSMTQQSIKQIAQRVLSKDLDVKKEGFEVEITDSGIWFIRNVGGIDLNPANLKMNVEKNGSGIEFAPFSDQAIKNMNIQGIVPIIINITPATNLPLLLGIATEEKKESLASAS
jgi:hypothetical protein